LALDSLYLFIRESEKIGRAHYDLPEALLFIAWSLPNNAIAALPAVFLLGGLLGLGALAGGSEIVVIRAAGVSASRIVWSAMRPGVALALLAFLFGEFVASGLTHEANEFRAEALGKNIAIRGGQGFWVRDAESILRVRDLRPDGALAQLEIYQFDSGLQLRRFARAETAILVGESWELRNVEATLIDENSTRVARIESETLNASISPRLLRILTLDPEDLSLRDLHLYLGYLQENGQDGRQYELAWWQKIIAPASHLVMLFIATPFVFGSLRQSAFGQRLFFGILIGLGFFLANRAMGGFGLVYGLPPVAAASIPTAVFLVGGLFALAKIR